MTYTPIPRSTPDWDTPLNAALTDQDNRITANEADIQTIENNRGFWASDAGFLNWNFDPGMSILGQSSVTSGTVHMIRMDVRSQITVSNIVLGRQTAASAPTAGQNFAGIYDASGTLLRQTGDLTTLWASTAGTLDTTPLAAPILLTPGVYHVAILGNGGGTLPGFSRAAGSITVGPIHNAGFTVDNARWGNGPTGQTSLPANINMSTRTYGLTGWWVALS